MEEEGSKAETEAEEEKGGVGGGGNGRSLEEVVLHKGNDRLHEAHIARNTHELRIRLTDVIDNLGCAELRAAVRQQGQHHQPKSV